MAVSAWSTSPALNKTVGGVNIDEGCSPAGVNDAMRAIIAEARTKFNETDAVLATGTIAAAIGTRIYTTKAALSADLAPADGLYALVTDDPTVTNNGLYKKSGASGSGTWGGPSSLFNGAAAAYIAPQLAAAQAAAIAAGADADEAEAAVGTIAGYANAASRSAAAAAASIAGFGAAATNAEATISAIQQAALDAIAGLPISATLPLQALTRTALAANTGMIAGRQAILTETGREGLFVWSTANLSTQVTADPQQALYVAPASATTGASGAWVRVIQSPLYASWFGAKGDGATDDTVAIQAGVNWLAGNGGGTLLFQNKVHIIAGALQDTSNSNSQIVLPKVSNYESLIPIRFMGAGPQLNSQGGSVLRSTLGAGTGAVIGCKNPHASTGDVHDNITWVNFTFENMTLELPQNPTNSGIDCTYVYNMEVRRSIVTVTGGRTHVGVQPAITFTTPTTATSYGIKGPLSDLPLTASFNEVLVFGLYNGIKFGELSSGTDVIISDCIYALEAMDGLHPSHFGRISVLSCKNTLRYTGASRGAEIYIGILDVEHGSTPMGGLPYGPDIYDPSNLLRGRIYAHNHDASYPFTVTGAENVTFRGAGGPRYDIFSNFASIVAGPGAVEAYAAAGFTPYVSAVGYTTATNDGLVGVFAGSNRAKTTVDKRLGGVFVSTDGSTDRGKVVIGTSDSAGNINEVLRVDSGGNIRTLQPAHFTQSAANTDIAGTVAMTGVSTTGEIAFSRPYANAPHVQITPRFDVGSGVRFWVTSTTTGFTINTSSAVTGSFSWDIKGAPN